MKNAISPAKIERGTAEQLEGADQETLWIRGASLIEQACILTSDDSVGSENGRIQGFSSFMAHDTSNSIDRVDLIEALKNAKLYRPGAPLRLHLGCGETYLPEYINIDYPQEAHSIMKIKADLFADITTLSCADGTVDEVRLAHVFEHFNRVLALALLIRWHEWLKIGGKLYIVTPDLMGCAKNLIQSPDWRVKMGQVRHLAGDQTAFWGYHLDHWFPERYERTLTRLGFASPTISAWMWENVPHLCNVDVVANKVRNLSREELLRQGDEILAESMVVPENEAPMHKIWCEQLRAALAYIDDGHDTAIHSSGKDSTIRTAGRVASRHSLPPATEGSERESISFVICCETAGPELESTLKSISQQRRAGWECIVAAVRDWDGIAGTARRILSSDQSLFILKTPGKEGCEARNAAIAAASSAWICVLEPGDAVDADLVELALQQAKNGAATNVLLTGRDNFEPTKISSGAYPRAALFTKTLWRIAGGFKPSLSRDATDWAFWCGVRQYVSAKPLSAGIARRGTQLAPGLLEDKVQQAAVRTLHPSAHSPSELLQDHETLMGAGPDILARANSGVEKFPWLSCFFLWRALGRQAAGNADEATHDLIAAARLAENDDWQPWFWLALAYAERHETAEAADAARAVVEKCPAFPLRDSLEKLIQLG